MDLTELNLIIKENDYQCWVIRCWATKIREGLYKMQSNVINLIWHFCHG